MASSFPTQTWGMPRYLARRGAIAARMTRKRIITTAVASRLLRDLPGAAILTISAIAFRSGSHRQPRSRASCLWPWRRLREAGAYPQGRRTTSPYWGHGIGTIGVILCPDRGAVLRYAFRRLGRGYRARLRRRRQGSDFKKVTNMGSSSENRVRRQLEHAVGLQDNL